MSVCLSVGLSAGCTVAKQLIISGYRLEWRVGQIEGWMYYMAVKIVEGERAVLGVNVGHPIVTDVVILCHKGWRRGFSQITLGFIVTVI